MKQELRFKHPGLQNRHKAISFLAKVGALAVMALVPLVGSAYNFSVDGIYYRYMSKEDRTVAVTVGPDKYEGAVEIPAQVVSESMTYTVVSIEMTAFENCVDLTSVSIPNTVLSIHAYAFYGCTGLTSVEVPGSVTYIGSGAFGGCNNLVSVNVESENSAYSSEDGVLFDKAKTELIYFPNGRNGVYTIPNSVQSIGNSAFDYCKGLTGVTIPESVIDIKQSAFMGCSGLESVSIGESVKTIGMMAFSNCDGLTSAVISNSVESIGDYAFFMCGKMKSLTIGESVKSIGYMAFGMCSELATVYSLAAVPPVCDSDVFDEATLAGKLYVPVGSVDKYRAADIWRGFVNVEELSYDGIGDVAREPENVAVTVRNGRIMVDGVQNGAVLKVFDLNGTLLAETCGGFVEGLPAGVYVVAYRGRSFKVAL